MIPAAIKPLNRTDILLGREPALPRAPHRHRAIDYAWMREVLAGEECTGSGRQFGKIAVEGEHTSPLADYRTKACLIRQRLPNRIGPDAADAVDARFQ
jgi:hypothetical protein